MDDLSTLLHDAVSDVEPTDRLAEIRDRTTSRTGRGRWYAGGAAGLAVAAAVTAIAIVSSPDHEKADDVGPASPAPTVGMSETPALSPQAVYFVGDTSAGPRLFREFRPAEGGPSPEAAVEALRRGPWDPDYSSYFPAEAITGVDVRDGVINVRVESWVHDRPANMTALQAELALQQVVYSVQAGAGEPLPVQFRIGRNPTDTVFGVPTAEPITNQPQLDVLALVSISDPVEKLQVKDSFIARGAASSFEGNVPWELLDADGTVVESGAATAAMETHLVEWETEPIDVSGLEPGRYTFVATTDDAKFTDTRTVVVL
ncbi:Gmad2 immunoglobulin-like domain-containing protein [Nocardioides dilutus]